jgi:hypothetical protein
MTCDAVCLSRMERCAVPFPLKHALFDCTSPCLLSRLVCADHSIAGMHAVSDRIFLHKQLHTATESWCADVALGIQRLCAEIRELHGLSSTANYPQPTPSSSMFGTSFQTPPVSTATSRGSTSMSSSLRRRDDNAASSDEFSDDVLLIHDMLVEGAQAVLGTVAGGREKEGDTASITAAQVSNASVVALPAVLTSSVYNYGGGRSGDNESSVRNRVTFLVPPLVMTWVLPTKVCVLKRRKANRQNSRRAVFFCLCSHHLFSDTVV